MTTRERQESDLRRWKVGELAKRTGISVRTLHHYDEIGLFSPSHRSRAGHRLYGPEDLLRLQQILSLRQLGLSLEEIGDTLKRRGTSAAQVVADHLVRVRDRIQHLSRLAVRLESLATALERQEAVSPDDLLKTMEAMIMFEKYYSEEQLQKLAARREALGDDVIRETEAEWPKLIAAVRAEMEKGTEPAHPEVQKLAARWKELIERFTGGDPGIRASLQKMYENEPSVAEKNHMDPAMMKFIGDAWAAAAQR
ncbi:MerR family transcriptional regulator [Chondromyces crocatus]|uniref:MerR family transcriptional regulator n=1 Tax=Chondromyces crocatus TaxID=52 RepID=A0A0K1EHV3_CHOCO|nr:MerR family transcriptional regulator [Chondromyces crocatus]AKT40158.1 MerR family transcriptional regulator [Chondromyces crocatus]